MKEASGSWHSQKGPYLGATARQAEDGDVAGVAAECLYVVTDPLQGSNEI